MGSDNLISEKYYIFRAQSCLVCITSDNTNNITFFL